MLDYYVVKILLAGFILSGLVVFSSVHKHFLLTLLSLEYIMLLIFLLLVFLMSSGLMEAYLLLVFLVMAVSEGGLGLSILVSLVRKTGGDFFDSFNLLEW